MVDAAVLVFHHTGIVSLVRGDHGLHDDGPDMVTDLSIWGKTKGYSGRHEKVQIKLRLIVKCVVFYWPIRIFRLQFFVFLFVATDF